MSATLEEVAKAAGVSVSTASRVLTKTKHPVRATTRQRVLNAASRLNYKPNLLARGMRTERTNTIGIVADDILSPFTPLIIRGIQDFFKTVDYLALIVNSDWDPEQEQEAISTLLRRAVEGIIFVESSHLAPTEELETSQKPYLFVHRLFSESIDNSVVPDDFAGAQLAMEHLYALGHRRIAHISGPGSWHNSQRRRTGYTSTLAAHALPLDPALIVEGDWRFAGGMRAAQQLLEVDPLPTAIFVANDPMAMGVTNVLQRAGLRVPEDVALVSYDNRDFSCMLQPTLTTVSLPAYRMGYRAAELLWAKLQDDDAENETNTVEEVRLCGRLYIRESCGAPAAMRTMDALNMGRQMSLDHPINR